MILRRVQAPGNSDAGHVMRDPGYGMRRAAGGRMAASRGFTLVELLVSLVILSTGIVLVLEAFQTSLTSLSRTREALRTDMLLREKLGEVELMALAKPGAPPADGSGRFAGEYGAYAWSQQVEATPLAVESAHPSFRVTVSAWRSGSSVHRSATKVLRLEEASP
jgi:prepilin-type N-terminal cleavage/methylation domain-containing protein